MNAKSSNARIFAACLVATLLTAVAGALAEDTGSSLWNRDWIFHLGDAALNAGDVDWEEVSLPHSPRLEPPTQVAYHSQGLCWYQRHFRTDPAWRGKCVRVRFDGAMQTTKVWLRGKSLAIHRGANRHRDFSWLGNAVPDHAAYRDIQRLKDAGFNLCSRSKLISKLSSPAFGRRAPTRTSGSSSRRRVPPSAWPMARRC